MWLGLVIFTACGLEFLMVALDKSWIVTKKNLRAAFKILDMVNFHSI